MRKPHIRIISIILFIACILSLAGCKIKEEQKSDKPSTSDINRIDTDNQTNNTSNSNIAKLASSDSGVSFIKTIKTTYASSSSQQDNIYTKPVYSVKANEKFEFKASDEAGYVAYKAFGVYTSADFNPDTDQSFCKVNYDQDTKELIVEAFGAIELNGETCGSVEDDSWGSYNKLYLVQFINLDTGEDLVKPFVIPFTIEHDLDAPVVTQGVSNNNTYTLSWNEVPGATEYRVYRNFYENTYELAATTTSTSITSTEFSRQIKKDNYNNLINQDLENWGITDGSIEQKINLYMNEGVKPIDENDGKYVVIAVSNNGKQSGISNTVDIHDIANMLPYKVNTVDGKIQVNITKAEELPAYVEVEMLDGSIANMIIDYHGSKATEFIDHSWIQPKVVNTTFSSFILEITGISYDDMLKDISKVTSRQDTLQEKVTSASTEDSNTRAENIGSLPEAPSINRAEENQQTQEIIENQLENTPVSIEEEELEQIVEIVEGNEPAIEPTEESQNQSAGQEQVENPVTNTPIDTTENLVTTPDGYTTTDLMVEEAAEIQNRLGLLNPEIENIIFARNDLQYWIALGLITNMEVITIPVSVFPDGANLDYVTALTTEAYRQNPTSGVIVDLGYSFDYESLIIVYSESAEVRLDKTNKELEQAKNIADQLSNGNNTEFDKITAINNYICNMASYDIDSAETDVDMSNLSENFVDSHTPYGVLCKNSGVCESYAESFILVGRLMGLDVRGVFGTLYGGPHEWNKVKVGNDYYIVDITNNDSEIIANTFLNATDEQTSNSLAEELGANLDTMYATDPTNEYYTRNNKAAKTIEDAIDKLSTELKAGSIKSGVRIPLSYGEEECMAIGQGVFKQIETPFSLMLFNGVLVLDTSTN